MIIAEDKNIKIGAEGKLMAQLDNTWPPSDYRAKIVQVKPYLVVDVFEHWLDRKANRMEKARITINAIPGDFSKGTLYIYGTPEPKPTQLELF